MKDLYYCFQVNRSYPKLGIITFRLESMSSIRLISCKESLYVQRIQMSKLPALYNIDAPLNIQLACKCRQGILAIQIMGRIKE
jgi:hypothetical protein